MISRRCRSFTSTDGWKLEAADTRLQHKRACGWAESETSAALKKQTLGECKQTLQGEARRTGGETDDARRRRPMAEEEEEEERLMK